MQLVGLKNCKVTITGSTINGTNALILGDPVFRRLFKRYLMGLICLVVQLHRIRGSVLLIGYNQVVD